MMHFGPLIDPGASLPLYSIHLHSVTTSRTSNTHQLVVGMTVHEILDMVAYAYMYICMHGSLLDHVPRGYCTLET